ncbi:MAG: type IX secretion system outer membrane channel protein PorV [Flammeovirgaceae bacterium]|nr:type IX secretion system outer membrane channel protein PorV [Flammeovirgaceae bacterium]
MRLVFILLVSLNTITLAEVPNTFKPDTNPSSLLGQDFRAITTAVPFLSISPDARRAALGDAGVASSADANAAYWNPALLVNIEENYGGSLSFTPWLGKFVNDMYIAQLSGFYKITREQVVSGGFKYFDLGTFFARDASGNDDGTFNPREFAFDVTYSRLLTENLSVGLTGRYIHSNLLGAYSSGSFADTKPGNSVAADVGVLYKKEIKSARPSTLALGASISNIGSKISYSNNDNKDFLPTNLRVGTAYTTELDQFNSITFLLDFNKLMVPSPPIRDSTTIVKGKNPDRSLLSGMFGSFSDAPDGFEEEIKEVMTSVGVEYWYNKTFAGRIGYFLESKTKGNRKYMTIGLGFRKDNSDVGRASYGIDVAYLVPTNKREHPLAETLRFTLMILMKKSTPEKEESVTDQ